MSESDTIEIDDQLAEDESAPLSNFVYYEIRAELARRGIPPEQVAFIQDYHTKAKRAALYAALNRGDIRVLIASKQSTGMNIQQRLIALHHLDCPWRPGDLEQREGRIIRQGNCFPEALVLAYVTEGSFDSFSWQTIETKASFIEQMKRGDVTVREIEDIGDAVLSAAEIKAIASGNPVIMEKVKLEMRIQQLEAGEAADRNNRIRMRRTLVANQAERTRQQLRRPILIAAQAQAQHSAGQLFSAALVRGVMTSEATRYTKREAAGEAILLVLAELEARAQQRHERQTATLGHYRGFVLHATAYSLGGTELTVRFEQDGELHHISPNPVSVRTALGVFASIDSILKNIEREIAQVDRLIADLDTDDTKIQAMLATPWDQELALREARERLERLDAELDQTERADGLVSPTPQAPDPEGLDNRQTNLVIIDTCDDDHHRAFNHAPMERPLVLLPEPSDLVAMAAALRTMSGRIEDADTVASETVAVTIEAAEQAAQQAASALVATLQLPEAVLTEQPHLTDARPRLVFGQDVGIARIKKTKKLALPAQSEAQASLFLLIDTGVQQLALFG